MKASDIFFKLMEAAQARGIEQCKGALWRDMRDKTIPSTRPDPGYYAPVREPSSVCVNGLNLWGFSSGVINLEELRTLKSALPIVRISLNNLKSWTFPDFYEYLKDKETAAAEKEVEPVTVPV